MMWSPSRDTSLTTNYADSTISAMSSRCRVKPKDLALFFWRLWPVARLSFAAEIPEPDLVMEDNEGRLFKYAAGEQLASVLDWALCHPRELALMGARPRQKASTPDGINSGNRSYLGSTQ